jgi:hypothetical protein
MLKRRQSKTTVLTTRWEGPRAPQCRGREGGEQCRTTFRMHANSWAGPWGLVRNQEQVVQVGRRLPRAAHCGPDAGEVRKLSPGLTLCRNSLVDSSALHGTVTVVLYSTFAALGSPLRKRTRTAPTPCVAGAKTLPALIKS